MYSLSGYKLNKRKGGSLPTMLFRSEGQKAFIRNDSIETELLYNYKLKGESEVVTEFNNIKVTSGKTFSRYFGEGSVIELSYEDTRVKTDVIITVSANEVSVEVTINYKQDCLIEIEGIKFSNPAFNRQKVNTSGDYLHVGNEGIYGWLGDKVRHRTHTPEEEIFYVKDVERKINDSQNIQFTAFTDETDYTSIRLLHQPDGFNSSFHFTNHADRSLMDQVLAIHYGTSDKLSPDYGEKGIIHNGIIFTWSVFARNEESNDNKGLSDPDYLDMVRDLEAAGHEIVPHSLTANGNLVDRAFVQQYLPYFDEFDQGGFIDHGIGSGLYNSLVNSGGWNPDDPNYYIMDLLQDSGIYNAWSYFDYAGRDMLSDDVFGWPNYILYQNENCKFPDGKLMWLWHSIRNNYREDIITQEYLNDLINACGVMDFHEYLAREDNEGHTFIDTGTHKEITDQFEQSLQLLKAEKEAGRIWNTTKSDWVDYNIKLKSLKITMVDPNTFNVHNPGSTIAGCSFLLGELGLNPKLNGVSMSKKTSARGTICWSDLPSGSNNLTI